MNKEYYKTDFLSPNNDFFIGMGSVINLAGNNYDYNYSNSAQEADAKALKSDWQNIGLDISTAIEKLKLFFKK